MVGTTTRLVSLWTQRQAREVRPWFAGLAVLAANAAQAMGGRGEIRVFARREADYVVIAIEDDGPGVPAELRDTLFEPLVTSKPKGTGLGLAICRQIIERHGGTIALSETGGPGARFEIRLPVSDTSCPPSGQSQQVSNVE